MANTEFQERDLLINEIECNLWETWANWGRGPGCVLHEENNILWFETPLPIIPYNGVLRFSVSDDSERQINAIINRFQNRQVPFIWVLHPSSQPPDLSHRLVDHGLKDVEPIYGMARTLASLPDLPALPSNIQVRKVADEHDANALIQFASWRWNIPEEHQTAYAKIVSQEFRFGMPGAKAHMWQAWHEDRPIAKVALYLGSRSAGIYAVATRPEARRQGLASFLTVTALHYAYDAGYHLAILHSTPMAQKLYKSMGFASIAEFRLFASEDVHM
ncbi:MAG: GNAT family N-acetyltransferase [Deltaproteobacteria bacterium]